MEMTLREKLSLKLHLYDELLPDLILLLREKRYMYYNFIKTVIIKTEQSCMFNQQEKQKEYMYVYNIYHII